MTVKVANFPNVESPNDLQVQFRSTTDTSLSKVCDGSICGVRNIQNLVGEMYLVISLPLWPSSDVAEILVEYFVVLVIYWACWM